MKFISRFPLLQKALNENDPSSFTIQFDELITEAESHNKTISLLPLIQEISSNSDFFSNLSSYLKSIETKTAPQNLLTGLCSHFLNEETDFVSYKKASKMGSSHASNLVGICYFYGRGVRQDSSKGCKWFKKSALDGNSNAMRNYGICLSNGDGINHNDKMAFEWYSKAVEHENAEAMESLGWCYLYGLGVDLQLVHGFQLLKRSFELGNLHAGSSLSMCYSTGVGVPRDLVNAVSYIQKSLSCNDPDISYKFGLFLMVGKFIEKDIQRSTELFQVASSKHHQDAQFFYGYSLIEFHAQNSYYFGLDTLRRLEPLNVFLNMIYLPILETVRWRFL